jgi:hypothetical protein
MTILLLEEADAQLLNTFRNFVETQKLAQFTQLQQLQKLRRCCNAPVEPTTEEYDVKMIRQLAGNCVRVACGSPAHRCK